MLEAGAVMPVMRQIRVVPAIYLVATVAAMLVLHKLIPACRVVSPPWKWFGLIPMGMGLLQGVWAGSLFLRRGTTLIPGRRSSRLVIAGPFRYTRNPMYLGLTAILVGLAVLLGSLTPWLMIPLFIWLIGHNVIAVEEAILAEVFGDEYRQYQARVRRWI
jgi:protein-S-isoprenylcysteine O-methyltransferase Ste14